MASLGSSTEGSFIEAASAEVVWLTDHIQAAFRTEFVWECRKKGYTDGAGLNITAFNAVRDHEPASLAKALELVFTPRLTEALKGRFGDAASSFYLQVERHARKILDARKPKKKKAERSEPPCQHPLGKIAIQRLEMERVMREMSPHYISDTEPGVTFDTLRIEDAPKTAAEAIAFGEQFRRAREESRARFEAAEKEFLGPPEPKTAQFSFTRKMNADKGERAFRYSRAKSPRTRRKHTAQT